MDALLESRERRAAPTHGPREVLSTPTYNNINNINDNDNNNETQILPSTPRSSSRLADEMMLLIQILKLNQAKPNPLCQIMASLG
jgi:hypothetical protein